MWFGVQNLLFFPCQFSTLVECVRYFTKMIFVSSSSACTLVIASASLGFWEKKQKQQAVRYTAVHAGFLAAFCKQALWLATNKTMNFIFIPAALCLLRSISQYYLVNSVEFNPFYLLWRYPSGSDIVLRTDHIGFYLTYFMINKLQTDLVFSKVNIQGLVVYGFRITRGPVYTVNLPGKLL